MKIEDITNLIETRRSHFAKEFNGNLAPKTLIENLINNANWAPSHKLTMPIETPLALNGNKKSQLKNQLAFS